MLECAPEDLRIENGRVSVAGVPGRGLHLAEVAAAAVRSKALAPVSEPGLNSCTYFYPDTVTWAFGTHGAVVEVDVETCQIRLLKYVAVHDCGRPINPMIVEGQLQGGIAQGIGSALTEDLVYDDNGQLLTQSFMDYGLPTAAQLPPLDTALVNFPSIVNDLGIKASARAVPSPRGGHRQRGRGCARRVRDHHLDLPVTPARLFSLLQARRAG